MSRVSKALLRKSERLDKAIERLLGEITSVMEKHNQIEEVDIPRLVYERSLREVCADDSAGDVRMRVASKMVYLFVLSTFSEATARLVFGDSAANKLDVLRRICVPVSEPQLTNMVSRPADYGPSKAYLCILEHLQSMTQQLVAEDIVPASPFSDIFGMQQ